jgi:hypothetical protein
MKAENNLERLLLKLLLLVGLIILLVYILVSRKQAEERREREEAISYAELVKSSAELHQMYRRAYEKKWGRSYREPLNDIEKQLISRGDYGPKPTQQRTKDYFASMVSGDAIYDFGVVSKAWIRDQPSKGDTLHIGWIQHVGITTKGRNIPWMEYRLFFAGSTPVCEITEEMFRSQKAAYVE